MSKEIVSAMFEVIEWKHEELAFITCPGKAMHTGKNAKKDCRVSLNGAPTLFCLHSSCFAIVEEANLKMRRACRNKTPLIMRVQTEEEKLRIKQAAEQKKKEEELKEWARKNKNAILKKYEWNMTDAFHESPFMTENPLHDPKVFLSLMYEQNDIIWNGDVKDSGNKLLHRNNFKTVKQWMLGDIQGNFTCPSIFKPDSFSRSNENVLHRPYIVIESDKLTQDETCSLYRWMQKFMTLRAIVHSGGKSAHGWFDFPEEKIFNKLKIILPELGCDPALFKASQPVRMPGIMRGEQMQCLYWFNP